MNNYITYFKLYKIEDKRYREKKDTYARDRVGRVFDIHMDYIKRSVGYSIFLECVKPSYLKSVITSKVISYCIGKDLDYIRIYTKNSIYYFERVYDIWE